MIEFVLSIKFVENFMDNHCIMCDESFMDKGTMVWTDELGEDEFESVSQGLSDNLQHKIAYNYRSKVFRNGRAFDLRNQLNIGVIEKLRVGIVIKEVKDNGSDILSLICQ